MNDLEALGHVKFDVLALSLLDKLMYIEELLGKGVDK
jgi:DNA polymerase III alpha subunit